MTKHCLKTLSQDVFIVCKLQMALPLESIKPSPVLKQRIAIAWRNIVHSHSLMLLQSLCELLSGYFLAVCCNARKQVMMGCQSYIHPDDESQMRIEVFSLRIWQFEQFSIQYREIRVFSTNIRMIRQSSQLGKVRDKTLFNCDSLSPERYEEIWGMRYEEICLLPSFDVNASIVWYRLLRS